MPKDIRVLIIEDDSYARDLMALLLTRDWRTQVVGEFDSRSDLSRLREHLKHRIDLVLLDTEIPGDPGRPLDVIAATRQHTKPPVILLTGTRVRSDIADRLAIDRLGGYILKGEVLYALASAVSHAARGHCVISPGVRASLNPAASPPNLLVVDGRRRVFGFTPREGDLVRLSIIFNLAVRDLADELVVSPAWASEVVSTIYRKLGMREILTGETPLEDHFDDEAVLARCREIIRRTSGRGPGERFRKAPWMSTLAFHLLTTPEISEAG